MDLWYFAYGSNLLLSQMSARLGERDRLMRRARLANYQFVFHQVQVDGAVYADILTPGEGVNGVAYLCTEAELQVMDGYEAGYDRIAVMLTDDAGEVFPAVAYIMRAPVGVGIPSAEYLGRIVTGARQQGVPGW